ncbi:chlorophyll synthesis pathway protein BchC [Tabrizicola sp.]|uniref:chlorophyll synthesis pathway protein BchC n=1 Tax=Tabrizicola sp. TaxID=2005166 RepID=UPI003F3DE7F3
MQTKAVILSGPLSLKLGQVELKAPAEGDVVVRVRYSGISTGTEKLLWLGTMPSFPGMGYPLVPGYESFGEVVEAQSGTGLKPGDHVFVPGANCYEGDVRGLFGGAAGLLVTSASRVARLDPGLGEHGALLALAATAYHALAVPDAAPPDLIIGHGTLGRLLARLALVLGHPAPTVWEIDDARQPGADGYPVLHPDQDPRRDYRAIYDASGATGLLDTLVPRLARGGEVVLCGFYTEAISFAFPPAFMKELRLRIASEWQPTDLAATRSLIEAGRLSLDGLITHRTPATQAANAYERAFTDPSCLKMILDWSAAA